MTKSFSTGKNINVKAHAEQHLLGIGFGSSVVTERIITILSPNSAPMKRLKDEAKKDKRLVDATHGRKTRSIIVLDSNHVVLSAIHAETISNRYIALTGQQDENLKLQDDTAGFKNENKG